MAAALRKELGICARIKRPEHAKQEESHSALLTPST
jgi:hypothetical protein